MGLLDFANTPEGMQGLSLLAAAAPTMEPTNLAGRLATAGNTYRGLLDNQLKQKYIGAQIDNFNSEIATRQAALAKQQQISDYLGKLLSPQPAQAGQGQLGSGTFGVLPTMPGQPDIPAQAPQGGSRIGSMSIDQVAGLHAIGGPNLMDAYKFAREGIERKPGSFYEDMQGRRSYVGDPTKGIDFKDGRIQAMPGAETIANLAGQTADAQEGAKAKFDLVKVYNPATQREEFVSRAQVLNRPTQQPSQPAPAVSLPSPQAGVKGGFTGDPAAVMAAINSIKDPQERANALQAFNEQANRTPGFAAGGNFAAGPSSGEAASAAAAKAGAIKQAESDVKPVDQRKGDISSANYMLAVIDRAMQHPGLGDATGLQGLLDPRNYIPGTDAKDFQVLHDQLGGNTFLQAYANLKGGGQITEVEGTKAQNAIARLNRAQSTDAYKEALQDLRAVVVSGLKRMGTSAQAAGVPTSFPGDNSDAGPRNLVATLPKTAAKGARARDITTNQWLVFNGLSWTPEK